MFNKLIIFVVKGYQVLFSPLFPPSCRFYPTCSEYSIQAFKTQSFLKACLISGWRILRCNPFSKGGYDPIKERVEN